MQRPVKCIVYLDGFSRLNTTHVLEEEGEGIITLIFIIGMILFYQIVLQGGLKTLNTN